MKTYQEFIQEALGIRESITDGRAGLMQRQRDRARPRPSSTPTPRPTATVTPRPAATPKLTATATGTTAPKPPSPTIPNRPEPLFGPGSKTPSGQPSPTLSTAKTGSQTGAKVDAARIDSQGNREADLFTGKPNPAFNKLSTGSQTAPKPDIFTDTPVGGKPYGNATKPATAGTGTQTTTSQTVPKPAPTPPVPTTTSKPVPKPAPIPVKQTPTTTTAPAAATAGTNTSKLSDDMIGKAFAARKATMMRGDGGEYSNMGTTPEEFRSKFNSLPPNRQRAILRRLSQ